MKKTIGLLLNVVGLIVGLVGFSNLMTETTDSLVDAPIFRSMGWFYIGIILCLLGISLILYQIAEQRQK